MSTFQKVALGVIAVAIVTTLVYPTHNTSNVIYALAQAFPNVINTATGVNH